MPFPLKTGILTTDNTEDTENTEKDRKDFRQKNEGQKNREEINKPRITRKTRIREDKYPPRPLSFCSIIFLPFYFSVFHPCFHPCFLRGPFSSLFFAPLRLCAKSQSSPPIRVIRGQISPSKLRNRKRPANPPALLFFCLIFSSLFVFFVLI